MEFNSGSLKRELSIWSKKTRLPAVSNIADNKSSLILKLIWIFCIILFGIFLIIKIFYLIINYFNYEKLTNLQIKAIENETEFPVVTVKFLNWLNYDRFISN